MMETQVQMGTTSTQDSISCLPAEGYDILQGGVGHQYFSSSQPSYLLWRLNSKWVWPRDRSEAPFFHPDPTQSWVLYPRCSMLKILVPNCLCLSSFLEQRLHSSLGEGKRKSKRPDIATPTQSSISKARVSFRNKPLSPASAQRFCPGEETGYKRACSSP